MINRVPANAACTVTHTCQIVPTFKVRAARVTHLVGAAGVRQRRKVCPGVALAIEIGADAVDIGMTIHPHPTLGESIGMAAEVAHGSCTDLPPVRK